MKRSLFVVLSFAVLCASAQGPAALLAPDTIGAYPLSVTERFTTNLLFPSPIFRVDLGSGDVLAKKMGKTENVLLLKANRAGVRPTNVSVYLNDGRFYSFVVRYADTLTTFNYSFCSGPPRVRFSGEAGDIARLDSDAIAIVAKPGFLHAAGSDGGVRLSLRGLYTHDALLWLVFSARNRSEVEFERDGVRITVEDRHRVRRAAVQSVEVDPVMVRGGDFLGGGRRMPVVVALRPLVLARGKRMVVEWREAGGGRRVRVVVSRRQLLRARKIAQL
ncbi:MAG TPA: DUF4138 domain-containing protein [Puia sp.]|uniref:DUF4138 domain-containing protein n=1 Tax=Puia sp. TaxID=2045100 RepID=UPI002BE85B97|nr:DUF4138 domain-containing protein [Puia sp.]HVU97997.1 DUF4138 domain-containing protein [Puia sp.]